MATIKNLIHPARLVAAALLVAGILLMGACATTGGQTRTRQVSRAPMTVANAKLTDGSVYSGQIRGEYAHGRGVRTWPDGKEYAGDFVRGRPHGYGVMTMPNGSTAKGYWQDGRLRTGRYRLVVKSVAVN